MSFVLTLGSTGLIKTAFVGLIQSYPGAWFIHQWLATEDFLCSSHHQTICPLSEAGPLEPLPNL